MNYININNEQFKNKEDAIKYIKGLNENLVVKIYAYPDLSEGRHGPLLKDEYHFKSERKCGSFALMEYTQPIIAELRNTLIKIYGAEYDYVAGSKANPVKLWDVKVDFEFSDDKNVENFNMKKLVTDVKESFK